MAESSGELLGGRYRLLGERTAFPFGSWWEAEDDQGARTVVLRMNAEVANPAAKAKAAVAATAALDQAHIVPWADGGLDAKGQGWLAAPMFGPWSLTEHVSRGEGIPPGEAAPLMHQVVRAVASAEAAGIQHNTLTSEFVRLVPLPEGGYGVKVYGFGLSDLLPSFKPLRKQDAYLGVPDYMSPELCAGKAAEGASADIYALGIIMYEAVRGRPPFAPTFASASASTTLKRHIFEKPLPLHVRYANAPFIKTYETICFKALAKTANRRQLSVAELEKELELLIVDEMRSQVVSLASVSGRGPTTSRRLRTQVIAQIPVDEPKVEVKPAEVKVEVAAPAAAAAPAARVDKPVESVVVAADEAAEDAIEEAAAPRRGDSTLVFAGLGPAVRELAEAARRNDEDDEGSGEEEAEPAGATSGQPKAKGKKKKGRKGSTGVVISQAPTTPAAAETPRPVAGTTPSSATVVTSKVSEAATGERAGTSAAATADAPGARIRKKDDAAKAKNTAAKGGDEEWFSEDDTGPRKSSKAWILLLLAAAVVVVVVILLITGNKNDEGPQPPVGGAAPTGQRYRLESEPQLVPAAPEPSVAGAPRTPSPAPQPTETLTAPAPAVIPPTETKVIKAEAPAVEVKDEPPKVEPKTETPKVEPAKVEPKAETRKVEPAKVEPKTETPKVEPAKVEPKLEPAKVEPPKVEPKLEPAKVEPPKVEPAADTPAKVDPPGSPEDQFRSQAKHYIQLGLQAYKSDNFKLAIGYFKKAQEADPTNAVAAQYLKKAQEKAGQ